jgi:hypothetical protein
MNSANLMTVFFLDTEDHSASRMVACELRYRTWIHPHGDVINLID